MQRGERKSGDNIEFVREHRSSFLFREYLKKRWQATIDKVVCSAMLMLVMRINRRVNCLFGVTLSSLSVSMKAHVPQKRAEILASI